MLDNQTKKNIITMINREKDIFLHTLPFNQLTSQGVKKQQGEILADVKKQIESGTKKGQSVMVVVVNY